MGRERRRTPVVAVRGGTPGAGPEEPELRRSCEGDGLWAHSISKPASSRSPFGLGSRTQSGAAACGGETDAVGDATLALCFAGAVVGMAVCSAKALLHGKGRDWEMMAENIP